MFVVGAQDLFGKEKGKRGGVSGEKRRTEIQEATDFKRFGEVCILVKLGIG